MSLGPAAQPEQSECHGAQLRQPICPARLSHFEQQCLSQPSPKPPLTACRAGHALHGENNGSLYLSIRDATYRMSVADLTGASGAFDGSNGVGFIEVTQEGHFRVKALNSSRARCWRITWEAGLSRKAPSWNFLEREPDPQSAARWPVERGLRALKTYRKARDCGRLPVLDTDTLNPFRPEPPATAVSDSNTLTASVGVLPPNGPVRDSRHTYSYTMG
jgi:hypothetical protein